jgi:hypothetical protein
VASLTHETHSNAICLRDTHIAQDRPIK